MVLDKLKSQVKTIKEFINQQLFYFYLRVKSKIVRFFTSPLGRRFTTMDVTPLFVFLALRLVGYNWTLVNLLGSIGLWIVFKEVLRHSSLALRKALSKTMR